MRLNLWLAPCVPIIAIGFYAVLTDANLKGELKQKVFSVTLDGKKVIEKVPTLERPIITASNIANSLKYNLVKYYSYKVEDIDSHIYESRKMFNETYYKDVSRDTRSEVDALIDSEVRVVDFLITDGPVYMGSMYSETRNWNYYTEGYFTYHGNFSKHANQFKKVRMVVSLKEARTTNGNASGVEIYKIEQF